MFRSICSETAKSSTFTHLVKLCLASRDETDTQTLISRSKNKSGGPRNSLVSKIRENYAEFISMLEFLGPPVYEIVSPENNSTKKARVNLVV